MGDESACWRRARETCAWLSLFLPVAMQCDDALAGDLEDPTFFGGPQEGDRLPQPFRRIGKLRNEPDRHGDAPPLIAYSSLSGTMEMRRTTWFISRAAWC